MRFEDYLNEGRDLYQDPQNAMEVIKNMLSKSSMKSAFRDIVIAPNGESMKFTFVNERVANRDDNIIPMVIEVRFLKNK